MKITSWNVSDLLKNSSSSMPEYIDSPYSSKNNSTSRDCGRTGQGEKGNLESSDCWENPNKLYRYPATL
jgi:hypothetical protein